MLTLMTVGSRGTKLEANRSVQAVKQFKKSERAKIRVGTAHHVFATQLNAAEFRRKGLKSAKYPATKNSS